MTARPALLPALFPSLRPPFSRDFARPALSCNGGALDRAAGPVSTVTARCHRHRCHLCHRHPLCATAATSVTATMHSDDVSPTVLSAACPPGPAVRLPHVAGGPLCVPSGVLRGPGHCVSPPCPQRGCGSEGTGAPLCVPSAALRAPGVRCVSPACTQRGCGSGGTGSVNGDLAAAQVLYLHALPARVHRANPDVCGVSPISCRSHAAEGCHGVSSC